MKDRNWGYKSLVQDIGEGFDTRQERMAQITKAKEDEEALQFERELGKQHNVPDYVFEIKDPKQRQFWLKHYLKPKSLGEHVSNIADKLLGTGTRQTQQNQTPTIIKGHQNQPLAVQIGGQIVPTDQLSEETLQNIQMLEEQNAQAGQHESTFGTKLGNALSGFGTRAVSLASG